MADTEPRPAAAADDPDGVVHEMLARCIEAWQASGAAGVEMVLATASAAVATMVRERLAKLERAGLLVREEGDAPAMPEQLGEFRLLRRLGSGGMGVVFLAEQLTLGRQVAVKVLRPEQRFFPGARARFRREVEVVARLGDPGIVPIYSVGEDAGVDWFAMEYVRGASLGDAIAALHGRSVGELTGRDLAAVAARRAEVEVPAGLAETFAGTWVQTSCRIVVRMARAVQHAHERGVVHRDLKPNNTMVTPDGRVLLLDFGLAAAEGSARITRSGAMLGTLHYMAPEQVREGATDVRTDVYALGVTLYELLALGSPFAGAQSEHGLRERIVTGTWQALRERNEEVPREVATIAAVAMDRDPARRYATAAALADDLERFLQHRPIQARPIGRWLRSVRWAQRHPALTTAAGLSLLAALATPFLVAWTREHAAVEIATANEHARANLGSAVAALDGILKGITVQSMNQAPVLDAERRRQLDDALVLVRRLVQENAADEQVARLFVEAMRRVASVRSHTGDDEGALAATDEAAAALAALRERSGRPDALAGAAAGIELMRGTSLGQLGRWQDAAACWRAVVARHDATPLAALDEELAMNLFGAHNNLAGSPDVRRDPLRAMRHLERCLELEAHVWPDKMPPERMVEHVRTVTNLAMLQIDARSAKLAVATLLQVLDRVQAALRGLPDDAELLRAAARARWGIARALQAQGDHPGARREREQAVAEMRTQAERFPRRASYRSDVATMQLDLAADCERCGDRAAAMTTLQSAIALLEPLRAEAPASLEFPAHLARACRHLARLHGEAGDAEAALGSVTRAVEWFAGIVASPAGDRRLQIEFAEALLQRAGLRIREELWEDARDDLRAGRDAYEAARAAGVLPAVRRYPALLLLLARAELVCDDTGAAMAALRRLQEVEPLPAPALQQAAAELQLDRHPDFPALLQQAPAK